MSKSAFQWTRENVMDEIRSRVDDGNSIYIRGGEEDRDFVEALYEHFGGWTRAFVTIGFTSKVRLLNFWTEDEVIRCLKRLVARGEPINTLSLERNHPRLWNASRRLFMNIESAVKAAGIDYEDVRKRRLWTVEKIKDEIRQRYQAGEDITQTAVLRSNSRLLAAGQKFFGSWSKAVKAAGINYKQVKVRHRTLKAMMNESMMMDSRGGVSLITSESRGEKPKKKPRAGKRKVLVKA